MFILLIVFVSFKQFLCADYWPDFSLHRYHEIGRRPVAARIGIHHRRCEVEEVQEQKVVG